MKTIFKQKAVLLLAVLLLVCVAGVLLNFTGRTVRAAGTHEDTKVTAVEVNTDDSGMTWFTLSPYEDSSITNFPIGVTDEVKNVYLTQLSTLNTLEYILFDGEPLSESMNFSTLSTYINLWGRNSSFALNTVAVNSEITIKTGCEFPSYAYASGTGDTVYVTTNDVTFTNENGSWVAERETKIITDDVSLMIGEPPADDITWVSVRLLEERAIFPTSTHVNDNVAKFSVDPMQYILIGDNVENGQIANKRTAREIVTDNQTGETSYTGSAFPMSMGGIYCPIDVQTSGGSLAVWILKEYKAAGAFSIIIKSGLTVTDGEYNYVTDEDIIYSYNTDGIFTRFYEITWKVDGTETKQIVPAGTRPVYEGNTDKQSTVSTVYTFDGWMAEEGGEVITVPNATANATYYAKYSESIRQYDITFNVDGQINTQKVDYNTAATEPEVPVKEPSSQYEYTFDGWYNGDEKWDFSTPITENVILTAKFSQSTRQYNVTFDGSEPQKYDYGSKIAEPAEPVKDADAQYTYTFDGWYNGDEKWDFENDIVTADVVLESRFTHTLNRYTIIVTFEGLEKEPVILNLEYGEKIDFSQYAEEGYTYIVKNGDTEVESFTVMGTATLTVVYAAEISAGGCNTSVSAASIAAGVVLTVTMMVAFAWKKRSVKGDY